MPLEKPTRSKEATEPSAHASTTRLRVPEPRRPSATWVARSTVEELPSFAEDESPSTDTIVGLGASGSRTVPLPRTLVDVPVEIPPPSRVPTVIPHAVRFLDVLEDTMKL